MRASERKVKIQPDVRGNTPVDIAERSGPLWFTEGNRPVQQLHKLDGFCGTFRSANVAKWEGTWDVLVVLVVPCQDAVFAGI